MRAAIGVAGALLVGALAGGGCVMVNSSLDMGVDAAVIKNRSAETRQKVLGADSAKQDAATESKPEGGANVPVEIPLTSGGAAAVPVVR